MADTTGKGNEFGELIESWMKIAQNCWLEMGKGSEETLSGAGLSFDFDTDGEGTDDDKFKTYKTWQSSVNNFSSLLKIMMAPENQESLSKSFFAFTEGMAEVTGESLENIAEFQSQLVKSFTKVGEHTKAYSFDDLDRSAFESFRELYKTEFQKYLNIPKIGLPREFHEQLSHLTDTSNIFSSYLAELFYLFTLPIEKSNRVMQRKMKEMIERGELGADSKQLYNEWIKVLEGHYMELLKSKDYTEVLDNTIGSLAAYKNVKTDVTNVFLKQLQIPTSRDMDEVYKDLYQMKKKIKELSKKVARLESQSKA